MRRRMWIVAVLGMLVVAAAVVAVTALWPASDAMAQQPSTRDEPLPSVEKQRPLEQGSPEGLALAQPGPLGPGTRPPLIRMVSPAALAAYGNYVYVLRGNTLYQYSAEGLVLSNKVRLEDDSPRP